MKKIRQFLLTATAVLCSTLTTWAEPYNGVSQEPVTITASNYTDYGFTADNWKLFKDYYGIRNAAELYGFAELVNGGKTKINGVLTANIEINENVLKSDGERNEDVSNFKQWTPIGTFSFKYAGTFDGLLSSPETSCGHRFAAFRPALSVSAAPLCSVLVSILP